VTRQTVNSTWVCLFSVHSILFFYHLSLAEIEIISHLYKSYNITTLSKKVVINILKIRSILKLGVKLEKNNVPKETTNKVH